jgi:cobalt transporter subunit CbtB
MTMEASVHDGARPYDERLAGRIPALVTLLFGILLLFSVGFMPLPAVHNGAHDTRHANGFPCH